jgi:hypothetical protein
VWDAVTGALVTGSTTRAPQHAALWVSADDTKPFGCDFVTAGEGGVVLWRLVGDALRVCAKYLGLPQHLSHAPLCVQCSEVALGRRVTALALVDGIGGVPGPKLLCADATGCVAVLSGDDAAFFGEWQACDGEIRACPAADRVTCSTDCG